jgi:putative CocE/NonD family hydrolase
MIKKIFNRPGGTVLAFFACILLLGFSSFPQPESALSAGFQDQKTKARIGDVLREILDKEGVDRAVALYRELKQAESQKYNLHPASVSMLGFRLVNEKRIEEAIRILEVNLEFYPDDYSSHGFLGYALMAHHFAGKSPNLDLAKKHLKRSDELNKSWGFGPWCFTKIYTVENYTKKICMVPMRDGIRLYTKVYIPKKSNENYPILLHRSPYGIPPYGEDKMSYGPLSGPNDLFLEEGYIFVEQDVRGRFMSEGKFMHVRPHNPDKQGPKDIDESSDTWDTIDWLLENIPGHNGKVGIWGTSYMGFYSVMALLDPHPALTAAAPAAPGADLFMGDDVYHNGALHFFHAVNFFNTEGVEREGPTEKRPEGFIKENPDDYYKFLLDVGPVANINTRFFNDLNLFWNQVMTHDTHDEFWKARTYVPHLKDIRIPVLNIGGWFDAEDLYGTLKTYQGIEENNPASRNTLVMGPWYHGHWSDEDGEWLGDIRFDSGQAGQYFREQVELPFFNYHLKGRGTLDLPEALSFETGANEWRRYDRWPPKESKTGELYLQPGGELTFASPAKNEGASFTEYLSNPADPVPMQGEVVSAWDYKFMHADQRFADGRPDVVSFSSDALTEDMTIVGPIYADLFVSTTGTDGDWIVKVIDVYRDDAPNDSPNKDVKMGGYQMMVRHNVIRGKFRNSFSEPEPFVPGEITPLRFELSDINHTFRKGHKLMVQIQSSCFPLYDRNPQQFMKINKAGAEDFKKATIRIHHSAKHPSHLDIRIIMK